MTEGLAIEIACNRMQELGINKEYLLRYRHFQLLPAARLTIKTSSDMLILLSPDADTRVMSKSGIYDLQDTAINEMQYVHSGNVIIENINPKLSIQVKFLQVIPKLPNS